MTQTEKEARTSAKKEQLLEAVQNGVITQADIETELTRKETPYVTALKQHQSGQERVMYASWDCPTCGLENRNHKKCPQCGTPKP